MAENPNSCKKMLILGGYGNTGRPLAKLLLQETALELVLAGRNLRKAEAAAAELGRQFYPGTASDGRVSGLQVDASDKASLRRAFSQVDFVVVASSTTRYVQEVAEAALEEGIDYLDVQYSTAKMQILKTMARRIEAAGRCFITDGGFHPGLPAALIRSLAPQFDRLHSARVGSVIKIDWRALDVGPETMDEFVAEFMDFQSLVFRDGRWQKLGSMAMMKPMTMDFGPPFGRGYCLPMFLEEMRAIPELFPEIRDTGFYVGGFNWFTDWILSPIIMLGLRLAPDRGLRPMGRLMGWSLETFSGPPYGTLLKAETHGEQDGRPKSLDLLVAHEDGYFFTAVPAACCLLQYLDGSIRRPGLWLQATCVDPGRLLSDMARMGIEVRRPASDRYGQTSLASSASASLK